MPRAIAYAELPSLAGQEIGVSDWLTITQERVDLFADATGDDQWIHVDVERATREIGGTIVHGFLTLSLIALLAREIAVYEGVGRMLNYGCNKVRFPQFTPVGARLRLKLAIQSVEERGGGLQVVFENVIELEGAAKPACVAETVIMIYPA